MDIVDFAPRMRPTGDLGQRGRRAGLRIGFVKLMHRPQNVSWARFVLHQDLQTVLRCHIAAFDAVGGAPRTRMPKGSSSTIARSSTSPGTMAFSRATAAPSAQDHTIGIIGEDGYRADDRQRARHATGAAHRRAESCRCKPDDRQLKAQPHEPAVSC